MSTPNEIAIAEKYFKAAVSDGLKQNLEKVRKIIDATGNVLNTAHDPIASITTKVTRFGGFSHKAREFVDFLKNLFTCFDDFVKVCRVVGRFVPEVGTVISNIAKVIQQSHVFSIIEDVCKDAKAILDKADNLIMKITDDAGVVLRGIEDLTKKIPGWSELVGVIETLFELISTCVYFFWGGGSSIFVQPLIQPFVTLGQDISGKIDTVKSAMSPVTTLVESVKNSLNMDAFEELGQVIDEFKKQFEPMKQFIDPIITMFRGAAAFIEETERSMKPLFCILETIMDAVGKPLELALKAMGFEDKMRELAKSIESELGLTVISDKIKELGGFIDVISENIKKINLGDITSKVQEFEKTVEDFAKRPGEKLFELIAQGLQIKDLDLKLSKPIRWEPRNPPDTKLLLAAEAGDYGQEAKPTDPIQMQRDLDKFIYGAANMPAKIPSVLPGPPTANDPSGGNGTGSQEGTDSNTKSAPELSIAMVDGQPASVVIRIVHDRILDSQANARARTVDSNKDKPVQSIPSLAQFEVGEPEPSSNGQIPSFDAYVAQLSGLLPKIETARSSSAKMKEIAKEVDADLASYDPGALEFCGHLKQMLSSLDPTLQAFTAILELPPQYSTALMDLLRKFLADELLQQGISTVMDAGFSLLWQAAENLKTVQSSKEKTQAGADTLQAAYKDFHQHVAEICSPGQFSSSTELHMNNFTSMAAVVQQQFVFLRNNLLLIKAIGAVLLSNRDNLDGSGHDVFTKLELFYKALLPTLEVLVKNMDALPGMVDKIMASMKQNHSDVTFFFAASKTVSEQCRKVEQKVLAASGIRDYCIRFNFAKIPFEDILARLGLHADTVAASKASSSSNEIIHGQGLVVQIANALAVVGIALASYNINGLLEKYFGVDNLDTEMLALENKLKSSLGANSMEFKGNLSQLLDLSRPNKSYKITTTTVNKTQQPQETAVSILNPILDDDTAKSLMSITNDTKFKKDASLNPTVARWSAPGLPVSPYNNIYLLSWARVWDDLETQLSSSTFLAWYDLLEHLDALLKRWLTQPLPSLDSFPGAIHDLAKPLLDNLQSSLNHYSSAISKPLQQPLHDRMDKLIMGIVQLPQKDDAPDVLRLLPRRKDIQLAAPYALPPAAVDAARAALMQNKSPQDAFTTLDSDVAELSDFEDVAVHLRPYLEASDGIYTANNFSGKAALDALKSIHSSYLARIALELGKNTGNQDAVRSFLKLAGSENLIPPVKT